MKLRALNAEAVRQLLSPETCIDLMRRAFVAVARGETIQPIRQAVRLPDGRGLLGMMPGHVANPSWLGVKVLTIFECTATAHHSSHLGMVLLFDSDRGIPRAIVDASEITAIRTAAATAAATDALARPDAKSLAIFGCGEQASRHLLTLPYVRAFERIVVWGRDPEKARRLAAESADRLDRKIEAVADPELAARADVICTTTAASEPFFPAEWLRPGQHLNAVGSSIPTRAEFTAEAVRKCRYFCDYRDSALTLAGELKNARQAGLVGEDHILGSVGQVIDGTLPGRTAPGDITMFKSLGMVSQDLLAADYVLSQAERRGLGQLVEW